VAISISQSNVVKLINWLSDSAFQIHGSSLWLLSSET